MLYIYDVNEKSIAKIQGTLSRTTIGKERVQKSGKKTNSKMSETIQIFLIPLIYIPGIQCGFTIFSTASFLPVIQMLVA
jgi:hypothetical protein